MTQATLNVRIDASLKKQFEALCSDFGMTPSTAVNVVVKALVRERRIPFEIAAPEDPFWSEANIRHLRQSLDQFNAGKATTHELIEDIHD